MNSHKTSAADFSRERKLTFQNLLLFLMRLCRPSIQSELDRFFRAVADNPDSFDSVSKSAFSQARKKLSHEAFIDISESQLSYFDENAPYKKDWLGRRVVAIDGSTVSLPYSEELKKYFDKKDISSSYSKLMAATSTAYDVNNQLVLDAQISSYGTSEISLAELHLKKLKEGDIVVMDRGYPAFWWFALLLKNKLDFCIRLNTTWTDAKELLNAGKQADIDWNPKIKNKMENPKFKEHGLSKELKNLRLVCIELPNGEWEVLATSLTDRNKYSIEKMKELYNKRWKIEENYKFLKHVLEIEHFSGKSVGAIKQDFFARVFMCNMASMITSQLSHENITAKKDNKYQYQLNRTQSTAKIRDVVVDLFRSLAPYSLILNIEKLLKRCLEVIRPNRKSPRKPPTLMKKNMNYKGL